MFARVIGGGPGGLSDEEPDAAGDGLPEISPENANNEEAVDVAEVAEVVPPENPEVDDQQEVALTGQSGEVNGGAVNEERENEEEVNRAEQLNEMQIAVMGSSLNEQ